MRAEMTRRSALAAAASFPFARAAYGQAFDTDVVIVGAGAAGLAAAHELRRLQRNFVVLESSDRIGGRLYTETGLGAPYDAGALCSHWAERPSRQHVVVDGGRALVGPDSDADHGGEVHDHRDALVGLLRHVFPSKRRTQVNLSRVRGGRIGELS